MAVVAVRKWCVLGELFIQSARGNGVMGRGVECGRGRGVFYDLEESGAV